MNRPAKHIGFNVVAYGQLPNSEHQYLVRPMMEICQTCSTDDNVFSPAQSVSVNGKEAVANLRDFCNELLGEEVKK